MLRFPIGQTWHRRVISSLVEFSTKNTARKVTLNRVDKLNALNVDMCKQMIPTLQEYAKSNVNSVVIIESAASPRAFCAGGDVAACADAILKGEGKNTANLLFSYEYSLNWLLAAYPKPVVVFMDGITMGGGVGLSIHVPFRIATENTRWAMPEMDIGFFPDVGVTFAFPKVITLGGQEGQLGYFLCATGAVLSGTDAYMAGLASHYINSDNISALQTRLGELQPNLDNKRMFDFTNSAILEFTSPLPDSYKFIYSNDELDVIENTFKLEYSVADLIKKLKDISKSPEWSSEAQKFAAATIKTLSTKSRVSLEVCREQFRRNYFNDIKAALKQDLVTAINMAHNSDSCEFAVATTHKLISKKKSYYPWKMNGVSMDQLSKLVSANPSTDVALQDLNVVTFKKYPFHEEYTLPTEAAVQSYVTGTNQSERSLAITKRDALKFFTAFNPSTRGKVGVRELVSQIIDRKCIIDRDGFLSWKY